MKEIKIQMANKLSVAIIGTNGLPGRYGGWDQLMNHLTIKLQNDFDFGVYTSSHDAVKGLKEVNGAQIEIVYLKANGYQSVLYDGWSMIHAIFKYDVLLVLGTSGCIFLPFIKLFKKPVVLNPDGAEWKRGKWSKSIQAFLKFSEKTGVKFASIVITDNKVIQDEVYSTYGVESHLVEYGGNHASHVEMSEKTKLQYGIQENKYAFKVCRIEPENNIDLILEAFSQCKLPLIIIGNWNFSEYGKAVRKKYEIFEHLTLLDPIYEQTTLDELRSNCFIYVHGHSVGGTNPSLVEAMSLGLNCAIFDVTYNRETTENKAMYFKSVEELANIVNLATSGENTFENGQELGLIASRRYTWDRIVSLYKSTIFNAHKMHSGTESNLDS